MKFRPSEQQELDVNLTPLIDVVFLLLIFFMVTTTFDKNAELKIELPTASNTSSIATQDKLELVIDGKGRYYVNGREVLNQQPEVLFQAMSQTLDEMEGTPPLVISADASVDYQAVVTAMDIAGRLGLTNFSLATSQTSRKPQE